VNFETLRVRQEGPVLFADIAAVPMNLLGTELVRDLVSLIRRAEADDACHVLIFTSADPDYFISHVDVTRISEYPEQAAKLTGEPSTAILFRHLSASRLVPLRRSRGACAAPVVSSYSPATCALLHASQRFSVSLNKGSP
jgi:enoyl-CoA hydratase/carnithine racemase